MPHTIATLMYAMANQELQAPESDQPRTSSTLTRAERLQLAVEHCRQTNAPTAPIARQYNLSPTTLYRHVCGGVGVPGGQLAFSAEQEEVFVRHLLMLSDWLVPISVHQLRMYVGSFLSANRINVKRFKDNVPGKDWAYGFLRRHSDRLANRRTVLISPRKGLVESEVIRAFFDRLKLQLAGTEALSPSCILNFDETNLTNDPGSKLAIVRRGQKNNRRVMNHSKTGFSVMFAAAGDGTLLPPYVVFKSQSKSGTVNPKWMEGCPSPLAEYDTSESGWFKTKQFEHWFIKVVIPWAKKSQQPKLVIGDNLSAHFSDQVMALCREYRISFKCFPPNTTHFLQPLDVAVFGPLKKKWRAILNQWRESNPRASYNKQEFSYRLKELIDCFNPSTVIAGFKAAGLVPFDVNEALRHLPIIDQPPRDETGADLVSWLQSRSKEDRPPPSAAAKKRPPPGTDLQDPGLNESMEALLEAVTLDVETSATSNVGTENPAPAPKKERLFLPSGRDLGRERDLGRDPQGSGTQRQEDF